ncbi:unnamed protein product [Heterobilharzia americana]|nr:unnamed protein product [Heterobilharzia americana]
MGESSQAETVYISQQLGISSTGSTSLPGHLEFSPNLIQLLLAVSRHVQHMWKSRQSMKVHNLINRLAYLADYRSPDLSIAHSVISPNASTPTKTGMRNHQ